MGKCPSVLPDEEKSPSAVLYFRNSDEKFIFYKLLEDMLPRRGKILITYAPIV